MAAAKVDEVYILHIYLKHQTQNMEQKGLKLKMMVIQSEVLESINSSDLTNTINPTISINSNIISLK